MLRWPAHALLRAILALIRAYETLSLLSTGLYFSLKAIGETVRWFDIIILGPIGPHDFIGEQKYCFGSRLSWSTAQIQKQAKLKFEVEYILHEEFIFTEQYHRELNEY